MRKLKLRKIGPMPPYYDIAEYIWGKDVNIDSDGDSYSPDSTDWTELTLILRSDTSQRVDIDPSPSDSDLLVLEASYQHLTDKAVTFLKVRGSVESIAT
jgi:hypothetical protein